MWQQWAIFFPKKTFVLVARTFVFVLARLRVLPGKKNSLVMIMSYESLPMSCPGNTRSKSLKPMKYDIYSSRMFKLCYFAPCRRREARGRCKEGNSQCTHPLPACSWRSWASEASSKIGPHPATSPSYSCHNVQITYIAALCNWHMKTGLELESPVLKGSSWISLFLAMKRFI